MTHPLPTVVLISFWGLLSIASGAVGAILAGMKNRDVGFWLAWTFLVPPMLIPLLLLRRLPFRRILVKDDSPDQII